MFSCLRFLHTVCGLPLTIHARNCFLATIQVQQMTELTYRLKSDSGLSEELYLPALQQMTTAGKISEQELCTSDGGETWVPVSQLLSLSPGDANVASAIPVDVSSLSANDTTVKASSETLPEGLSGPRKLKRMSVASGKSRFSKVTTDRPKPKVDAAKKTDLTDLVGSTLPGGRYTVLSQYGSGSMAYVFRASDNRLETDVIIKVPKPEKITTDDFRDRFKRESQLLVRLSHPHVVKVVDVGEFDDLPYVVMQLLSGGTLLDRMRKDSNKLNQMTPDSLETWVREVARALDFCYKKGMVHRDVKPANILFDDDDNAYVSDFGLTKIMHGEHTELCSNGTANGVVLGTPNYLPPEIILGAKFDGRADQYSLAITVYHALFGRPPMQGTSATVTMINQTQKKLELLSAFRSDVPRELALAVQKGIEKNPKDRFESCEEFAMAVLAGLGNGQSSSSISTSPQVPALVANGPVDSGEWHAGSSTSSRKVRRKPSGSGQRKRKKSSSASSAARRKSDWLEPAPDKLPPRKSAASKARVAKQKATKTETIAVFGQEVSPLVLALTGIFVFLPTIIFIGYRMGELEDVDTSVTVAPAEWPSGEHSQVGVAQTATSGEPASRNSMPQNSRDSNGNSQPSSDASTAPVADQQPTKVAMLGNGSLLGLSSTSSATSDTTLLSPKSPGLVEMTPSETAGEAKFDSSSSLRSDSLLNQKNRTVLSSEPEAKVTHGPPGCPIVIVGNSVWSVPGRRQTATLEGKYLAGVQTALSANGKFFAAASKPAGQQGTDVVVWDTDSGRKLFTAFGDSKRFADTILLSSTKLFIGDRWSDELLVWECNSGKQKKPLKIRQAKFKQGNTAVSHNGEFVAAVAVNQLCVFKAGDGEGVAKLAIPRFVSRKQDSAAALYSSLQSLAFSPDNSELVTVSSAGGTKLLCWNGRGEIVLEHDLAVGLADRATVQWFEGRRAWLLGSNVLDRESRKVLVSALSGDENAADVHLYDDEHLCGYFADNPNQITLAEIPWDEVDTTVLVMKGDVESFLRPGTEVSVVISLGGNKNMPNEHLQRTLKAKLSSNGLKILDGQRTKFVVRIAGAEEGFVPLRKQQLPRQHRDLEFYPKATGPQLVMELFSPSQTRPVWSVSLGDATSLLNLADTSDTERSSRIEKFTNAIDRSAIPYYMPANEELIALPAVLW